ncbi:MAG: phosphatidate cytidylyltransferase [Acidimicrobiales bacterium]
MTPPESTGPATERVRIVGAEPAGEVTSELPVVTADAEPEQTSGSADHSPPLPFDDNADTGPGVPAVRLTDEPGDPGAAHAVDPVVPGETAVPTGTPPPTELPHWTEPPTGQVPAVLSRDSGDEGAGSAIAGPSWREDDADWVAHDEHFEPAMLGDDEVALGSLDESDRTDVDRRPWEFDLDPGGARPSTEDHMTEPVEMVGPLGGRADRPDAVPPPAEPARPSVLGLDDAPVGLSGTTDARSEPVVVAAGATTVPESTGGDGGSEEELFAGKPRPTGSPRVGRARRNGLRPARMRAKRPEDVEAVTDTPLAAEPPGASVTDVPGAGRRRGGLASLAAADRTAEQVGTQAGDEAEPGGAQTDNDEGAAVAAAATAGTRRRIGRRSGGVGRGSADVGTAADAPTGGGPPAPGRMHRRAERAAGAEGAHEEGTSIGLRVGTGIAVAVVALLAFKLGTIPSLVLTVVVVTFAAGECFGVLRRAGYHPATLLGLVGTISLMVGAYSKGIAALPLILVLITVFTLIWYLVGIERGSPVAGTAATLLTVGWVSLLGSYAGLLLSPSAFPNRHGIAFLLGAIIATVANDVGALVIGRWLGSRPLAPSISPNKTWEGLFGGAVFSILVSTVVVGAIHPWSAANAALLGVVVAVVAPIGDLCESLLKRDLRLKDMGTLLPGHGGVLDRVDALLFVLPATYYLVRALNIG